MALVLVATVVWAVVGLVGLLDLSADGETETPQAVTAGATPTPTATDSPEVDEDLTAAERRAASRAAARAARAQEQREADRALAEPSGPCADGDVVVTPTVPDGHAGSEVTIVLELTTIESPACTWEVDPEDVFVTIKDDAATLWSSQHCPAALPTATAVPRRSEPDKVRFTWNAKESVPGCSIDTAWVWPGVYQVTAVARGSVDPVETLFTLGDPVASEPVEPEKSERGDDESADEPDADTDTDTSSSDDDTDSDSGSDSGSEAGAGAEADEPAPETEAEAADRREKRREALREARRQHREERRAERDAG